MAPLRGDHTLLLRLMLLLPGLCLCEAEGPGPGPGPGPGLRLGPGPTGHVPEFAKHFGTKTRYEDVVTPPVNLSSTTEGRCSPIHLTAVIRHGTRFPTVKNVKRMARVSRLVREMGETGDPEDVLEQLRQWEQWYTEDMDGQLVEKGRSDLSNLAMRLVSSFPGLLSEAEFHSGRISIKTSSKHRCVSSAEAFQDGLRLAWDRPRTRDQPGNRDGTTTETSPEPPSDSDYIHEVDDSLMRFFEHCRGYVEGVETNATATAEVELFKHGPEFRGVRTRVALRLGLDPDLLTPDLVEAAFFICSYELAIKSLYSPWCRLFTKKDAEILEYKGDLKQYWRRAHGFSITPLSSCPLFHHIFRSLDKAGRPRRASDPPPEPASILIGHAETLLPLIALLGLYKDKTPPTAANYQSQQDRLFRSSLLVPYSAHLVFVLYDCPRGARLRLLTNEAPLLFPGATTDLPLYREVRALYRHLLDGCDYYTACEGRPSRAPNTEL